jgi:drug/metabolite transporter (DMT)-like permease
MDGETTLTPAARWLGYAGLLPQAIFLALALGEPRWSAAHGWGYVALAGGFAYGAAIFSFLGGVWWGQAIARADGKPAGAGAYLIAVMPSLLSVALFLPWTLGWEWPGPALLYLGVLIALSPMVDRALGFAARDFMALRVQLSIGLGLLTIALGVVAESLV